MDNLEGMELLHDRKNAEELGSLESMEVLVDLGGTKGLDGWIIWRAWGSVEKLEDISDATGEDLEGEGVVAAVGHLIDTVALIGDELAERTQIERSIISGTANNISVDGRNLTARRTAGRRYSHADRLFQAAHIFHLCSIVILGVFVVEVRRTLYSLFSARLLIISII